MLGPHQWAIMVQYVILKLYLYIFSGVNGSKHYDVNTQADSVISFCLFACLLLHVCELGSVFLTLYENAIHFVYFLNMVSTITVLQ